MRPSLPTLLLGTLLASAATAQDFIVEPDPSDRTQGKVTDGSGTQLYPSTGTYGAYPLQWALEQTAQPGAGRQVMLRSGFYDAVHFKQEGIYPNDREVSAMGGTPGSPVVVYAEENLAAIIEPLDYSHGLFVLATDETHTFHNITWRGVQFRAVRSKAGVHIGQECQPVAAGGQGITYDRWRFRDCEIDGRWDYYNWHYNDSSKAEYRSKWGVRAYSVGDFTWLGGTVHDIWAEHAFYISNISGPLTIFGCRMGRTGRTAIQLTARAATSTGSQQNTTCGLTLPPTCGGGYLPAPTAPVLIQNNTIVDTGLQGASPPDAITITGRHQGQLTIRGNKFFFGHDAALRQAALGWFQASVNFGPGAILHWSPADSFYENSADLLVDGNLISYEATAGHKWAMYLNNLDQVTVTGNTVVMGARNDAIRLGNISDPSDCLHTKPLSYCVDSSNALSGPNGAYVLIQGVPGQLSPPQGSAGTTCN